MSAIIYLHPPSPRYAASNYLFHQFDEFQKTLQILKNHSILNKVCDLRIRGTFKQLLNQNDQYANFIVTDVHKSRDFQTIAYTLRHLPSQANYTHFATNIIHNQGALLFKTPPADDSGVAHVV